MHGMVFTKIFRRLILGLWGATLCSCTTYRTLSIEILQPAGFHIEQGKKLALLERNIRNENSILTFMKNIPELRTGNCQRRPFFHRKAAVIHSAPRRNGKQRSGY